jgi:hypothetical protein
MSGLGLQHRREAPVGTSNCLRRVCRAGSETWVLILEALLLSMDSILEQGRSVICCRGNLYSGVLVSPLVVQGDATAAERQPTQLCGVPTQLDGPSIVGSEEQLSSGDEAQTLDRGRFGDVKAFNWCPVDHSNHAVHSSADPQRVSVANRGRVPLQVSGLHI